MFALTCAPFGVPGVSRCEEVIATRLSLDDEVLRAVAAEEIGPRQGDLGPIADAVPLRLFGFRPTP